PRDGSRRLVYSSCFTRNPLTFFKSNLEGLGTFKVETELMNCKQTKEVIDSSSRRAAYGDVASAHLSGCPDCRHHADETDSLLALLKAQPRVEAPADFDFRLRARIARAEAEQVSSAGVLETIWERFFAQTFSWGQAAAAMVAVAMVVTVSISYI